MKIKVTVYQTWWKDHFQGNWARVSLFCKTLQGAVSAGFRNECELPMHLRRNITKRDSLQVHIHSLYNHRKIEGQTSGKPSGLDAVPNWVGDWDLEMKSVLLFWTFCLWNVICKDVIPFFSNFCHSESQMTLSAKGLLLILFKTYFDNTSVSNIYNSCTSEIPIWHSAVISATSILLNTHLCYETIT